MPIEHPGGLQHLTFVRHRDPEFKAVAMTVVCMHAQDGDELTWVARCTSADSLLLANSSGKAIRFKADDSQVPMHFSPPYTATCSTDMQVHSAHTCMS